MPQPPTSDPASAADVHADPAAESSEPPSPPSDDPEPTSGRLSTGSPRLLADSTVSDSDQADKFDLSFTLDTPDVDPPAAGWLESHLRQAVRLSGVTTGSLSVTLIDAPTMTRLHAEYCNDPTPTDILTFDLADREPPKVGDRVTHIEGDLVICRDEAERQAAARGHDARAELLLYTIHGLMHLLGEDDHNDDDFQRMHRREDELLTRMGLGPVFDVDPISAADQGGAA